MTSDLCTEDVVVRITTPQIITPVSVASASPAGAGPAGAELGRRLLVAARAGDTAAVLELMARGAPFSADWLGTSPLHLAAAHAHAATCAVLLRAGVSRDARTKVERTPLHLAAAGGHARVLRLLLEAGAAVDARDMLRMTPLHWAVQRGHAAAARELLMHGADPHARSKFHKSPLSLAAELRRDDLRALIDDALREREAKRSVDALVTEQMADITPAEPQIETFDAVQRIQDLNQNKPKQTEKTFKTEQKREYAGSAGAGGAGGPAAALLRQHGITLLPTDDGSTVLNALQSGRTVVLSDAGKLMLKESSQTSPPVAVSKAAPVGEVVTSPARPGVLLTATPVTSPPRPGVKIFTLNNKLLAAPRGTKLPAKKIINPQDMQVKFVQLPPDAKIISPSKIVPMKAKNRLASRVAMPVTSLGSQRSAVTSVGSQRSAVTSVGSQRPAVKIIMNKSNFNRLIANATRTADHNGPEVTAVSETVSSVSTQESPEVVGEPDSDSPLVLRAQLAAAQRALAALRHELRTTRARLALYENTP